MTDPTTAHFVSTVLERTVAIAGIPAPSGAEGRRAELVRRWWTDDGWDRVDVDATGNVWGLVRDGAGGAVILCAHLDTVFPGGVHHEVRSEDGRLFGPGVGDDAIAVAALSAVGALLALVPGRPVWLLATVGEEGLGNLRGIRGALDVFAQPIDAVIAVEGNYFGRVSATGVGSLRWRVTVDGPGGHAWEAADIPSAVHAVAAMVVDLAALRVHAARTAVNVGRIGGGEAINARARAAWFELDLRADDPSALEILEQDAKAAVDARQRDGLDVRIDEIGRRPAGGLDAHHPLVVAAAAALEDAGVAPVFVATSTDANAAHDRGIPAVAVGITTGGGEHTLREWVDTAPIADGLQALAATVRYLDEGRA
jgi:acetylornithine deacetylase/succinyl-diaminopimelate desuccinylase-like protein